MNKYQSYKSSGVEWIGEIPKSWDSGKMKYVLSNNDGGVWGTDVEDGEEGTLVVRSTEITIDGKWDLSQILKRKLTVIEVSKCKLFEGDIVITKSSGSPQHIGKSVIVTKDIENLNCCYSNFVQRIRFKNYHSKLYHYILNSEIVREQFKFLTTSSTGLGNLNGTSLNDILLPFIPYQEQLQIVHFLDEKTELIDELISMKKRKINLLKEQRISLINETVTKGLNSNVKMKGSGEEIIGEIPMSWNMYRVSNFGRFFKGSGIKKDEVKTEGIPCIRYGEIYTKYERVVYNPLSFIDIETSNNSIQIQKGDILFTGSGETIEDIGKSLLYFGDRNIFVGGDIIVLRPKEGISPLYLSYLMNTSFIKHQKSLMGRGEIIVHIYSKNIKEIKTPLPSIEEQLQIVEFLDSKTKEIDDLVQLEQKKIDLLKEYRQSLISEVVTGKIKVITDE